MSQAPRYHIIDDFLNAKPRDDFEREEVDYAPYSPYCVIAVFPLALPASADRTKLGVNLQGKSASISDDPADGVRLRSKPLILTDAIESAQVQTQKSSFLHQLQFYLTKQRTNYLAAILPGDWVGCWICHSEERGKDIAARLARLEPCNGWLDGFRFLGRVSKVRRARRSNPSGLNTVGTAITATGFKELGSQIFFDPYLAEATPLMGTWLARIGGAISKLLGQPLDETNGLDINKILPFFLDLLLGQGIDQRAANPSGEPELQIATGLTQRESFEAPYAYTVPGEVGLVTGRNVSARGSLLSYADLLDLITGIQRFSNSAGRQNPSSAPWSLFTPDGIDPSPASNGQLGTNHSNRLKTGKPLKGEFIPMIPDFSNRDVWSVLRQWLNPAINEMYTALRCNEVGAIVPTVVVRQLPLSSEVMADRMRQQNLTLTPILEVPRWVGHSTLIQADDLERSDDVRFNFIHVYGQQFDTQVASRYTSQIVRNPPIRNDLDIQRSGLHAYMTTVACSIDESSNEGAKEWMAICSDWLLDQHLTLSGSVSMELVPGPLVHGDNFEYDGMVAQIEGVTWSFQVNNGKKTASTQLQLTHGVRSDDSPGYQDRTQGDYYLFYGLLEGDGVSYDPAVREEIAKEKPTYRNTPLEAPLPNNNGEDPDQQLNDLLGSLK